MSAYSGEFVARMMQENDDLRGQITAVISLCDRAAAIDVRCEWMPLIRAALSAGSGAALTGDDRTASDLFARQAEIREGAITEIAEALGRCPTCGAFGVDRDNHCRGHQPGVADCPCTSCVDRFLDGQQ